MGIGPLLTLVFVLVALLVIAVKLRAANREAVKRDDLEKKTKEREKREIMEKSILDRLERLKNRDDLQATKDAIHKDPKRAAKVLSRMMRDK